MSIDPIEEKLALYRPTAPRPGLKDDFIDAIVHRVARRRMIRTLTFVFAVLLLSGVAVATRASLFPPPEDNKLAARLSAPRTARVSRPVAGDATVVPMAKRSPQGEFREMLPPMDDVSLLARSDVVVLGKQVNAVTVAVSEILKGTWTGKTVTLPISPNTLA